MLPDPLLHNLPHLMGVTQGVEEVGLLRVLAAIRGMWK
jgi:hypothetical protein